MKSFHLFALVCLLLSGCAFQTQKYESIDQSQKSITIPRGADVIGGPVKKALLADGWKIYSCTDSMHTVGQGGTHVDLRSSQWGSARYSLRYAYSDYSTPEKKICSVIITCGLFFPVLFMPDDVNNLNLSVVDNLTGQEVLTMSGTGFIPDIGKTLVQNLK
jgi:hypothetical protein